MCFVTLLARLLQEYGIQGFPTIKLFTPTSKTPLDYQGAREAKPIVDYVLSQVPSPPQLSTLVAHFDAKLSQKGCLLCFKPEASRLKLSSGVVWRCLQVKSLVSARLSGKVGGSSGRSQRQGSSGGGADEEDEGESAAVVLTSENFSEVVLDSKETGEAPAPVPLACAARMPRPFFSAD